MRTTKEQHEAALERWMKYQRECQLANTWHLTLDSPNAPPTHCPTVVWRRDSLLQFRAAYVLLRNAVADLLDLDPEKMTQGDVILAIFARHLELSKDDED